MSRWCHGTPRVALRCHPRCHPRSTLSATLDRRDGLQTLGGPVSGPGPPPTPCTGEPPKRRPCGSPRRRSWTGTGRPPGWLCWAGRRLAARGCWPNRRSSSQSRVSSSGRARSSIAGRTGPGERRSARPCRRSVRGTRRRRARRSQTPPTRTGPALVPASLHRGDESAWGRDTQGHAGRARRSKPRAILDRIPIGYRIESIPASPKVRHNRTIGDPQVQAEELVSHGTLCKIGDTVERAGLRQAAIMTVGPPLCGPDAGSAGSALNVAQRCRSV